MLFVAFIVVDVPNFTLLFGVVAVLFLVVVCFVVAHLGSVFDVALIVVPTVDAVVLAVLLLMQLFLLFCC